MKRLSALSAWLVLSVLITPGGVAGAGAEPRAMTAVDLVELQRIGGPTLSPDGRYVIYRRSEVNWEENQEVDRFRLVDLDTGEVSSPVEPEEAEEDFGDAVWADGYDGFVTLLKRDDDEFDQAYFYDLSDQTLTKLTEHNENIKDVTWAPGRNGFYFSANRARPEDVAADLKGDWKIAAFEDGEMAEIHYHDRSTGTNVSLFGGDFDVRDYVLSRDGKKILYVRADHTRIDRQESELWLYDTNNKISQRITNNRYSESSAALSPDNMTVAYIATVNAAGEPYYERNIFVHTVGDEESRLILPDRPMEMLGVEWDRAGTGLYILGNTGVRVQLYHYSLGTSTLAVVTQGDSEVTAWSYSAAPDTHTFVSRSAHSPGDVWTLQSGAAVPRQVTTEFAQLQQRFRLPKQRVFSWRGRGSVMLEGLLVYPLNYREGEAFPLVTITHGGPRSSSRFGSWNLSRYVPVLAGENYGIFLPNHRGGTGYGDEFMRDMVGRYFRHAHFDILDGIDALVDQGLADPDQLIKMGWSAGGHMTNKLITVTDRFRAASSGAGVADWVSLYGESDARFNRRFWFGGTPWEKDAPLKSYARQSLLNDAWRIETPTLFFVGERDKRVPPTQAVMMHRAAAAAGTETELYIAPGEPHNYRKPKHRLFKINTELAWYARHLGREPYAAVYPEEKAAESDATGE